MLSSPAPGLTASELGVLINTNDPQSVAVGEYYQRRRRIPEENIIRVALPASSPSLSIEAFNRLKAQIERRTPRRVQAFAVTWVAPYRVGCMSLNTAIAMGFSTAFCADGCKFTRESGYYDSGSSAPKTDLGIRPAMSIAAHTVEQARALIDRGVASDNTAPRGTAYLLSTSDKARNVRAERYSMTRMLLASDIDMQVLKSDDLRDRKDVMFYFTGVVRVQNLASNRFRPGAIGDHLTSFGGDLLGHRQMNILDWIAAGATGSFGTVVEPCAFAGKFPDVTVVMRHYLEGDTLIEAYWKSVRMPGQGIFVGEPLARPFAKPPAGGPAVGRDRPIPRRIVLPPTAEQMLGAPPLHPPWQ